MFLICFTSTFKKNIPYKAKFFGPQSIIQAISNLDILQTQSISQGVQVNVLITHAYSRKSLLASKYGGPSDRTLADMVITAQTWSISRIYTPQISFKLEFRYLDAHVYFIALRLQAFLHSS